MKKLMGNPGGPNDQIHQCISIEKKILDKTHSVMLGLSLDALRGSGAGEDDDPFGEESVGGGRVNESFESAQDEDDDGNTVLGATAAEGAVHCHQQTGRASWSNGSRKQFTPLLFSLLELIPLYVVWFRQPII
jgi:hypothetical protein